MRWDENGSSATCSFGCSLVLVPALLVVFTGPFCRVSWQLRNRRRMEDISQNVGGHAIEGFASVATAKLADVQHCHQSVSHLLLSCDLSLVAVCRQLHSRLLRPR